MHTKISFGKHEERPMARSGSRCEDRTTEVSRRARGVNLTFVTAATRKIK